MKTFLILRAIIILAVSLGFAIYIGNPVIMALTLFIGVFGVAANVALYKFIFSGEADDEFSLDDARTHSL